MSDHNQDHQQGQNHVDLGKAVEDGVHFAAEPGANSGQDKCGDSGTDGCQYAEHKADRRTPAQGDGQIPPQVVGARPAVDLSVYYQLCRTQLIGRIHFSHHHYLILALDRLAGVAAHSFAKKADMGQGLIEAIAQILVLGDAVNVVGAQIFAFGQSNGIPVGTAHVSRNGHLFSRLCEKADFLGEGVVSELKGEDHFHPVPPVAQGHYGHMRVFKRNLDGAGKFVFGKPVVPHRFGPPRKVVPYARPALPQPDGFLIREG